MLVQHFTASLAKPLLIPVPTKVTAAELGVLWEAGVDGVIVAAGAGQPPEALRKLRRAVDKLALPARRRQGMAKALLPQVTGEMGEESEEEE
jgi:nucleotide-binding universal stress UspA family protein